MKTATAERIIDPIYSFEKTDKTSPGFALIDGVLQLRGDVELLNGDDATIWKGRTVRLPDLVPGSDYLIFPGESGLEARPATREALEDPLLLGGFHFAPGGNAPARAGGDDVPAINPCSIWDVDFRPACPDPRGMAYVAGVPGAEYVKPFWVDLYLLNREHLTRGTSVAGVAIADGGYENKPLTADGKTEAKLDYATAQRIFADHGKSLLGLNEFFAAAFGVTERKEAEDKPELTGLDAPRTSRVGMMQATGNLYVWGHDEDPEVATRRACIFGGYWVGGDWAGSRQAYVGDWPADSYEWIGARGRSDHLQHD